MLNTPQACERGGRNCLQARVFVGPDVCIKTDALIGLTSLDDGMKDK